MQQQWYPKSAFIIHTYARNASDTWRDIWHEKVPTFGIENSLQQHKRKKVSRHDDDDRHC
jgi:hypothetical protein